MPSRGIGVPDVSLARTRRLVGEEEDSYKGCTTHHEREAENFHKGDVYELANYR